MTSSNGLGGPPAPDFSPRRLLLVVAGTPAAHNVPQWVRWMRMSYPDLEVRILLTRSALRFVTPMTMRLRTRSEVFVDCWYEVESSLHVELAQWAEACLVYPATVGYLARMAAGFTDTPSLLTLHSTSAVVALAPSLPPGALAGASVRRSWATLTATENVVVVPPELGLSLQTGEMEAYVPPQMPEVLARLEEYCRSVTATPAPTELTERPDRRSLRTGLLRTEVAMAENGAFEWVRSTGVLAPSSFATHSTRLGEWLDSRHEQPTGWAVGKGWGNARTYRAPGTLAVAGSLLRHGPSEKLLPLFRSLGERLAELHAEDAAGPLGAGLEQGTRGLNRLLTWLRGQAPEPAVALAEARLRAELGGPLLGELRDLAEQLNSTSGTIVHGAASLGSLVTDPQLGEARMLVGEDVGVAAPAVDHAWLLGELVELRWQRGGSDPIWQGLLDAVLEGCGTDLGAAWGRLAALRVALHLHDYTAYVSAEPMRTAAYPRFIRFLAEQT